jgi:glycosyltransferase involved in cell wall biosynthesis
VTGKRVLFVTPVAPWRLFGGTPTVSRNLIALFSETTNAEVCCLRSDEPGDYPRQIHGATVLTGRVSNFTRRLKFFFDSSTASFAHRQFQKTAVRTRFAALLATQRPDFVIFDHIYAGWLIDLVKDPSIRVGYIAHDDMVAFVDSLGPLHPSLPKRVRFASLRRQYQALQEKILQRCDFTLTMTPEDADRLRSCARGAVEVAPLFFEFPGFTRTYPDAFTYLLITGSFDTWEKQLGLTHFWRAVLPSFLARHPEFRIVIAGRISQALRQRIPLKEPQLRIVQAPSGEEMQEVVQQASAAVVLDLQASGLKIKTMELAATGLPVVSWAPGLEGTMLVPEVSCLRAETAAEFAAHLDRLYAAPDLRRRLGTAAQDVIQSRFSQKAAQAHLKNSKLYAALTA